MSQTLKAAMTVVGIDIGKNSFHVVGLDQRGAIVLRQKWSRGQVEVRFANMPPCLIGMEAWRQGLRFLRAELPGILATPPDVLSPRMVRRTTDAPEETAYRFYGLTQNGLLVVLASYSGGGTGIFYTLHVLDVATAWGFDPRASVISASTLPIYAESFWETLGRRSENLWEYGACGYEA